MHWSSLEQLIVASIPRSCLMIDVTSPYRLIDIKKAPDCLCGRLGSTSSLRLLVFLCREKMKMEQVSVSIKNKENEVMMETDTPTKQRARFGVWTQ
jgi:hypothetical protein